MRKTGGSKMSKSINVFLPMRAGSERIPKKNTKPFANITGGLSKIKLEQLVKCELVDKIIVSTDDPEVVEISLTVDSKKIEVVIRPSELATSSTSTDELIKYVPEIMPDGHILWTHVTSPFVGPEIYDEVIETYLGNLKDFDSLMTVTKIQKFIWNSSMPLNYDRNTEKWPRTQTLTPLWEVNSGAFLTSKRVYQTNLDRIGNVPFLFQLSEEIAFDIDWYADFKIAESLYHKTFSAQLSV